MERLTKTSENGNFYLPSDTLHPAAEGFSGPAADRLAAYEALHEKLLHEQPQLAAQLEALRSAGKKNSLQFKELFTKKMVNSNILLIFQMNGLG